MASTEFTARFKMEHTSAGTRYTFFCDLSGTPVYTTEAIQEENPQIAEVMARGQTRPHFNRCLVCEKWIADTVYNIDEMKCVSCAPYHFPPHYCTACGSHIPTGNNFCTRCGQSVPLKQNKERSEHPIKF